jgi:ATP:ADP antiporter, AAA family
MTGVPENSDHTRRWTGRLLRPFADVRPGEVATALILGVTIFTILTAYYLLKVIREPLILINGGAEVKSYAAAGQALLLLPVLRAHGALAQRTGRLKLIAAVFLFCASNLVLFAVLFKMGAAIGLPFYLWVGTFNFLLVATFWSFANDIYSPEQGKRLFPLIGVGSTVGALAGAGLASFLLRHLGPMALMLLAAGLLVGTLVMFAWVQGHQRCRPRERGVVVPPSAPVRGRGGFEALLGDRYLLLIGVIAVLTNWVTNSGEYVLDRTLVDLVHRTGVTSAAEITRFIGGFKANYFWWVNVLALLSQLFVVSRLLKHLGVGGALLMLPLVAMVGAGAIALFPVLWVIRQAKITEKGIDYSVENTALNALYLVVPRDAKYKAKAVADTFLVRAGDVCAAVTVWIGVRLGLPTRAFAALNVLLAVIWVVVAWRVAAIHRERSGAHEVAATAAAPQPSPA